jgi:hypothetical protein
LTIHSCPAILGYSTSSCNQLVQEDFVMAVGDVYQVVDEQVMFGQVCMNVWFFRMATAPTGEESAIDVANAFITEFLPFVTALQSTTVEHRSIRVTNLYDPGDVHEELVSVTGDADGDVHGTFEAYALKMTGNNGAVRPGSKRIVGVTEAASTDGVVDDSATLALLGDLATAATLGIVYGTGSAGTLASVIVKRIFDDPNYRLPANIGETVLSLVVDTVFRALVTSQVSRKVGVGS